MGYQRRVHGVSVTERSLDILHLNIIAAKALVFVMTGILSASLCSGAVSDCDNCTKKLNKFCCQRTKAIWMTNPGKKICCDFKPAGRPPYPGPVCNTHEDCASMGQLYMCCNGFCRP